MRAGFRMVHSAADPKPLHDCHGCGRAFATTRGLAQHAARAAACQGAQARDHPCVTCGTSFGSEDALARHKRASMECCTVTILYSSWTPWNCRGGGDERRYM